MNIRLGNFDLYAGFYANGSRAVVALRHKNGYTALWRTPQVMARIVQALYRRANRDLLDDPHGMFMVESRNRVLKEHLEMELHIFLARKQNKIF